MKQWWKQGRAAAAVAVALGMGASSAGWTTGVSAQSPQGAQPSDSAVVLSADLTVTHRRVQADGTPHAAQAPGMSMHVERRLRAGRWATTVVYRDVDRPKALYGDTEVTLANPFRVARVEIEEETGEATPFDARGRKIALPTDADRNRLRIDPKTAASTKPFSLPVVTLPKAVAPARPWAGLGVADLVAHARDTGQRRRDLTSRFGAKAGQVRGLDRYLKVEGGVTTEWLVQPDTALPVEINVAEAGQLKRHTEIRHARYADGHIREFVRTEAPAGGRSTDRVITEVQFSNVAVATGGRP